MPSDLCYTSPRAVPAVLARMCGRCGLARRPDTVLCSQASCGSGAIMKRCVVSILCLSFTACAPVVPVLVVRPPPSASGDAKPAVDVTNAAAVTPRDGAGAIVITRGKGLAGMQCTYDISLDDQHVAGLRSGERVTLYADPGERIVGVSIRREGSCNSATEQVAVQVATHVTTKVRLKANASYDLIIDLNTYGGSLPP